MAKSIFVEFFLRSAPERLVTSMRRKYAFCEYNYHSPVKIKRATRFSADSGLYADCSHCGTAIERDRTGQWRAFPVGLIDLMARASENFNAISNREGSPAIPLTAKSDCDHLIDERAHEETDT